MNMSVALALFFAVTVAYILIIDIFTILFRMTGLTEEKAKFQLISLLTNSGYTTKESELVVAKLLRRKMARMVMLFGYVFSVTLITVFAVSYTHLDVYKRQEYIRSKNDHKTVHYAHPMLEPILNDTYGCMVYQEQIMRCLLYTSAQALVRKAAE